MAWSDILQGIIHFSVGNHVQFILLEHFAGISIISSMLLGIYPAFSTNCMQKLKIQSFSRAFLNFSRNIPANTLRFCNRMALHMNVFAFNSNLIVIVELWQALRTPECLLA